MKEKKSNPLYTFVFIGISLFAIGRTAIKFLNKSKKETSNFYQENQIPNQAIEQYSNLMQSEYPEEAKKIDSVWNEFRVEGKDPMERMDLVTDDYFTLLNERFFLALGADKNRLSSSSVYNEMQVLLMRSELKTIFSKDQFKIENIDSLRPEFVYIYMGIMSMPSLSKIKFISKNEAFGVYQILNNYVSVHFEKGKEGWLINPLKEDPEFITSRNKLFEDRIRQYGGKEKYLGKILDTGKDIYEPLITD